MQINAVVKNKSTGRIVSELSEELQKKSNECFVAYGQDKTENDNSYFIGSTFDHKIHALFSRVFGLPGYFSARSTKKLLKYIDTISPDIVHLHNLHSNYVNIKMLLENLSKKNIPTVITLHDCFMFTGKCTHYTTTGCQKWCDGCGNCLRKKRDNKSFFFDRTAKMLKDKKYCYDRFKTLGVIGVSDWITNEAKKSILKNAKLIKRIYNWIDLDTFYYRGSGLRDKLNIKEEFIILGVASTWTNEKGLSEFIKISGLVDDNTKIVLVGNMQETNLPNNIISIKATNDVNELAEYYSMADVFLNLSLEETFGKVTAEALSCGTPSIVYNSTASPELIGKNCGYVVSPNDVGAVLERIAEINENRKEYYKSFCINFARIHFDKGKCVDQTIDFYNELLRER